MPPQSFPCSVPIQSWPYNRAPRALPRPRAPQEGLGCVSSPLLLDAPAAAGAGEGILLAFMGLGRFGMLSHHGAELSLLKCVGRSPLFLPLWCQPGCVWVGVVLGVPKIGAPVMGMQSRSLLSHGSPYISPCSSHNIRETHPTTNCPVKLDGHELKALCWCPDAFSAPSTPQKNLLQREPRLEPDLTLPPRCPQPLP